jgi:hypothetical protein
MARLTAGDVVSSLFKGTYSNLPSFNNYKSALGVDKFSEFLKPIKSVLLEHARMNYIDQYDFLRFF